MHKLSLLLLAGAASASEFHDIVKHVNAANAGWRAEVPTNFNSTDDVKALCGTFLEGHPQYKRDETIEQSTLEASGLPASFDARDAFPKCPVIGHVRDQSSCGSCWAFGSTETFEGRRCAHTGENIAFSTEDTTSCCNLMAGCFSFGCGGGQPALALTWMSKTGVVTGGDFGDKDGCRPYSMAPCAHHTKSSKYGPCPSPEYPTPACKKQCQGGFATSYSSDKHNGGKVTSLSGVAQIKAALQNGPVSTAFSVYADFPAYKSGVYKHTTGSMLGGHAVMILGYGTEDGTDYWLVKNSWNEEWGAQGFFKIAHGQCGIDSSATAIDW
eukprot:TRINITY_DN545_c0_g2_i1.p2 TRINITY_DN545_c0_g2~~TRINITY_DN545_c0_g2_i1.p2  ORF type:complete len:326 (+),score=127.36 TRINITY_DN545_c0_g2_i1:54-1031(+)